MIYKLNYGLLFDLTQATCVAQHDMNLSVLLPVSGKFELCVSSYVTVDVLSLQSKPVFDLGIEVNTFSLKFY